MTESLAPRALVERFLDLVDRGEWTSLPDFYAENAVVEQPFSKPVPLRLLGREAIRAHFAAAARGPFRLRVIDRRVLQTADPELVVAEYGYDGRLTTTGRQFMVANVQLFRIRGGQIIATRDYHDHAALAAVLGVG